MIKPAFRHIDGAAESGAPRGTLRWEACTTPQRRVEDRQFSQMEQGLRASGGIVCADHVVRLLRRNSQQPISLLARRIVAREVISFEWRSTLMLPAFQFNLYDMSPRPEVMAVAREFLDVRDNWAISLWFACPNSLLREMAPVDVIDANAGAVLEAARTERWIALG